MCKVSFVNNELFTPTSQVTRYFWMDRFASLEPLPRALPPKYDNGYAQRHRPLSFQPRFVEVKDQPLNNYGFPEPGIQSPTAREVTAKDYFLSDTTWEDVCNHAQEIDFIVIGSGFTALAFIEQTLKQDPFKRILCLERGDFWLPDHFQNLPLPFKYTLGGPSETFPFTLSKKTYESEVRFMHGSCPFFGGRSTFWSAWSPNPTPDLMRNWPQSLIDTSKEPEFFKRANKLLRVTSASHIGDPYAQLQKQINNRLQKSIPLGQIPSANEAYPAPMAVSSIAQTSIIHFTKFSTPGPLLGLYKQQQKRAEAEPKQGEPLLLATETAVQYLITEVGFPPPAPPSLQEEATVKFVRSSRHTDLPVAPNAKIILCAGAFPSTTLLLNSFQNIKQVASVAGRTVTGHFLTHIVGRVKRSAFDNLKAESLEIGAEYVAGKHPESELQYHIQVTAITSPDPTQDAEDAARFCPDYAASASEAQLRGSEDYVIFVCATLGELSEKNPDSFFTLNRNYNGQDPTSNCVLQVTLTERDRELWDHMDKATFNAIEVMAGAGQEIEWWHQPKHSKTPGIWKKTRPDNDTIRMEGIVHEASTLPLGDKDDEDCCVDSNYKVKGVSNVYVTGAALFPTSGSWNPTLTMCGYAQDLAIKLTPKRE